MRSLNGSDLAGFIKERQARQVRGLVQARDVTPHLAIVRTHSTPVIDKYIELKQKYGADLGVMVEDHLVEQAAARATIEQLNADPSVHGIIVQLPLSDPSTTDLLVNTVDPAKDVDGLGQKSLFDPATPTAVTWLLAGYNVELRQKNIVVVGQGRLVGAPLTKMLRDSGLSVETADAQTKDVAGLTRAADVIITATGKPGVITSDMVKPGAVVVDAGVATDAGKLVGDVAADVHARGDLTMTPPRGGVGPLTVCALFENVITAAARAAQG